MFVWGLGFFWGCFFFVVFRGSWELQFQFVRIVFFIHRFVDP